MIIPIEEKRKLGNPGHRRLPTDDQMPRLETKKIPSPPEYLNGYAIEEWNRIAGSMYNVGTLTEGDVEALASYCSAYSLERTACEEIEKIKKDGSAIDSMIVYTNSGIAMHHPLISIVSRARRDKLKYASELGLTPCSRTRIGVRNAEMGKVSKFSEVIGKSITSGK